MKYTIKFHGESMDENIQVFSDLFGLSQEKIEVKCSSPVMTSPGYEKDTNDLILRDTLDRFKKTYKDVEYIAKTKTINYTVVAYEYTTNDINLTDLIEFCIKYDLSFSISLKANYEFPEIHITRQ